MLIAGRCIAFGAATTYFGAALFRLYGVSQSYQSAHGTWLQRLIQAAALLLISGAALMLVGESIEMTGTLAEGAAPSALWAVATDTYFGAVWCTQLVFALTAVVLSRSRWPLGIPTTVVGAALVSSFAWMGHGAEGGVVHQGADVVHLLAAAMWLGALAPLTVLALRAAPASDPVEAQALQFGMQRFSAVGLFVVSALVVTGLINAWFLIGPAHIWRALDGLYGRLLVAKLFLFFAMLCLAALHRFWLTPELERTLASDHSIGSLSLRLRRSLAIEAALGLLVLGAAAWLGTTSPPALGE